MKKLPLVLASLLLMAAASKPVSLVQNEYDFAAAVAKQGVRDGFLRYLDKQAIGLSPTPVNDYDTYSKRPSGGDARLRWYPSYALLASSGDFGVDTGPWSYEASKDGKPVQAHGEWLTVWHLDESGRWKALFDGGIGHDAASTEKALDHDAHAEQMKPINGSAPAVDGVHEQLAQAETAFSDTAAHESLRTAYETSGSADLRLLLEKSQPVLGRDRAARAAPDLPSGMSWEPMGSGAARSGDLGYVYGETYKLSDAKHVTPVGVYMHVWRHEAGGWKLLIALEQPL